MKKNSQTGEIRVTEYNHSKILAICFILLIDGMWLKTFHKLTKKYLQMSIS